MTAISRTPENTNFLQPTKFLLTFSRIPDVTYFCQEANIPGITLNNIVVNSPMLDFHAAGNKLQYGQFNIRFMVDEKLQSWKNIHDWFRSIGAPTGFQERNTRAAIQNQFNQSKLTSYSDATLTVLSNLNNPSLRIDLHGLFPVSLSDIQFDTMLSADHIITADATFMVEYFDINVIS